MTGSVLDLYTFIGGRSRVTYRPGVADCALFQADCHLALTGVDLADRWRGRYSTIEEGLALMQADGYANPRAFAETIAKRVGPPFARMGDLAFHRHRDAGGFVMGSLVYFLGEKGLTYEPVSKKLAIFRVK